MPEVTDRLPGRRTLVDGAIVVVAILAAATLWAVGDRSAESLLKSVAAMAGAAAVFVCGRDHPVIAVAIVFALASASRLTLETPLGTLRVEQPAIVALVVVAAIRVRREGLNAPRLVWLVGTAVLVYLAVMAVSSALVAPQPSASLRMTLWWAISAAGGMAAFILLRDHSRAGRDSFVVIGTGFAVAGIMAAAIFSIAGPDVAPGIQETLSVRPRVYGLGWETNLYASYLAAILLLAAGAASERAGIAIGAVALLGIGFPLGSTRGAYLGLAAGALSMGAIIAWRVGRGRSRVPRTMISTVGVAGVALAVGIVCVGLLLPNIDQRREREQSAARPSPPPAASLSPAPRPTLAPPADTIGFRLARIGPAIDDFWQSPVIGLGAESFGQRHADTSQVGAPPDHLPFLLLAAPYEAGVIGAGALLFAILLVLWGLIGRTREDRPVLAASLVGVVVSLLVAYQATNALHFATNWLLLGLAMAVAWGRDAASTAAKVS